MNENEKNTEASKMTQESKAGALGVTTKTNAAARLILTLVYIILIVSFGRYELAPLLLMGVYPMASFIISELSVREAFKRLWIALPFVLLVGVFNPIFDRAPLLTILGAEVSGGVVSMLTLAVKGIYTILAAYILFSLTDAMGLFSALRRLHVPKLLVLELMLIYRYISLLQSEAGKVVSAYKLRAPGQKGIAFKAWGPLVGRLLIRSMDRAERVYQSMLLRGFKGEYAAKSGALSSPKDIAWTLLWIAVFFIIRFDGAGGILSRFS